MSYTSFYDPELGQVRISLRSNATRISARWSDGRALFIFPPWVSDKDITRAFTTLKPKLLGQRPQTTFAIGRTLRLDGGVNFHFERDSTYPRSVTVRRAIDGVIIMIGDKLRMDDPQTDGLISRIMHRAAAVLAPPLLLDRVHALSRRLGVTPRSVTVSRGHKVLGHCSSQGDIAISCACIFLPDELRDYVICHEFAHLREMNHSARFHALCDSYCGGKETMLREQLRQFRWPLMR